MRRLRILQIFNRYIHYGGEEASVFRIGDALQANHDVEYFFGSTQEFLGGGLHRISAPLRAFYDPHVATKLRRYQEVGRFDLWQIHNVLPGLSPSVYQMAFQLKIPIVHFLHNYRFGCVNGLFLNHGQPCQRCLRGNFWPAFQTACWRESHLVSGWQAIILLYLRHLRIFRKVSRWIALSESQKALHLQIGLPEAQISVVPHFYEPQEPPPPFSPRGPALFLSRLSREKGGQELLRAWTAVTAGPRELWIGGTGPEEALLREQSPSSPKVRFLGFLDAAGKNQAWAESSFAVIPSIVPETFGMIVLEAWARQRPVVGFRIGALAETVDHGVNGLLVEPGNIPALAKAMEEMFANPERSQKMGKAGWDKLQSVFTKAGWLSRIDKIYQSLDLRREPEHTS